jgi:hypothetical protein
MHSRKQGITLMSALCAFVGVVVSVQLWLLSAGIEAVMSLDTRVLWPAAFASLALTCLNVALLRAALVFDRELRH